MQTLLNILYLGYAFARVVFPGAGSQDFLGKNMAGQPYGMAPPVDKLPKFQPPRDANNNIPMPQGPGSPATNGAPDYYSNGRGDSSWPKPQQNESLHDVIKKANERMVHNRDFLDNVPTNLDAFNHFLNSDSDAREEYKKIISSFGVISPGEVEKLNLSDPDVKYIIKFLEELLALHSSFKMYIRRFLLDIDGHIRRVCDKIKVLVRKMKSNITEINILKKSSQKTRSSTLRGEYFKEYGKFIEAFQKDVEEFDKEVIWYRNMEAGLRENL